MLVFYGLKNCDTCRKALVSLKSAGREVQIHDVRQDGVPETALVSALGDLGAEKVLNKRSTTWRGLSDVERDLPPLKLLKQYPTLMKRPLIVADNQITIGWDKASKAVYSIE